MYLGIVVLRFIFQPSASSDEALYVVEVLLYCSKSHKKLAAGEVPLPCKPDEKGEMQVGED